MRAEVGRIDIRLFYQHGCIPWFAQQELLWEDLDLVCPFRGKIWTTCQTNVIDKQESKLHGHLYECVDSKNCQVRLIFGIVYQVEIHQLLHFYIAGLHAIYNICKEHGYVLPNSHCGDNWVDSSKCWHQSFEFECSFTFFNGSFLLISVGVVYFVAPLSNLPCKPVSPWAYWLAKLIGGAPFLYDVKYLASPPDIWFSIKVMQDDAKQRCSGQEKEAWRRRTDVWERCVWLRHTSTWSYLACETAKVGLQKIRKVGLLSVMSTSGLRKKEVDIADPLTKRRFLQNVSTGHHTRSVLKIRINGYQSVVIGTG